LFLNWLLNELLHNHLIVGAPRQQLKAESPENDESKQRMHPISQVQHLVKQL
jgi:hypothetical protein